MKKIILIFFFYSSFVMAEKNIFPVHNIRNLLDYGQLEFLKPNKKNIFMRYAMKSKRIKTYSLQDGCYQKDKVDNCVSEVVYLESSPDGNYSILMHIEGGMVEDLEENSSYYYETNNILILNHKSGCLVMAPSKYYVNWKGKNTLSDGDVDINLDKYFRKIPIFYRNNKLVAEDYYGMDNINSCRKSQ